MRFTTSGVVAALTSFLTASEAASIPFTSNGDADACSQIRRQYIRHGNSSSPLFVPGELGLECLKAMPFEPKRAVSFVKEYRKYMQFQSTVDILKNPPADYPMPPTDLLGGLDEIEQKAGAGMYESQYEFDRELQSLVYSAFDGHLSVQLCSYSVFGGFVNKASLVSISSNGTTLPEVYVSTDALQLKSKAREVSPVVSINGVDVDEYLQSMSIAGSSQDWDALYNYMFYTNPLSVMSTGMSGQFPGLFDFASTWPGAYQALHFANGSTAVLDTYAVVTEWPWHNAKAVYESICIPSKEDSSFSESSISFAKPLPAPAAYPKPFVKDDYNLIMGFFPEGNNLDDVAVLAIPSFDTIGPLNDQYLRPDAYDNFGKVARELLLKATEKGKKKVLVDLSGNGGGTIAAGLNLFRLFFPQEEIYSATRFRANEGLDFLGEALKRIPLDSELEGSILSWRSQVRPDQDTGFSSWEDLYGPHEVLGTNSSSLFASNMSLTSTDITPISGYGNVPLNPSETLFAPEDIVLMTDGICASTCTLFTELMKAQGVRTIAFGGRPQNGPMQAMGGVKGAQVLELPSVAEYLVKAKKLAEKSANTSSPLLSAEELDHWNQVVPIPLTDFPLTLSSAGINLLNAFGPSNDHLPRQFTYEAAECRRFYTLDNVHRQETTWASAADAMFFGGDCVPGSTNATGSLYSEGPSSRQRLLALILEYTSP